MSAGILKTNAAAGGRFEQKKSISFGVSSSSDESEVTVQVHVVENFKLTLSKREDRDRVWYSRREMLAFERETFYENFHGAVEEAKIAYERLIVYKARKYHSSQQREHKQQQRRHGVGDGAKKELPLSKKETTNFIVWNTKNGFLPPRQRTQLSRVVTHSPASSTTSSVTKSVTSESTRSVSGRSISSKSSISMSLEEERKLLDISNGMLQRRLCGPSVLSSSSRPDSFRRRQKQVHPADGKQKKQPGSSSDTNKHKKSTTKVTQKSRKGYCQGSLGSWFSKMFLVQK